MSNPATVDLTKNEKQITFYNAVMRELSKDAEGLRNFFYGGAIRGGKTYLCLTILVILSRIYAGSRWYVIRESGVSLNATTIPSIKKILKYSQVKWSNKAGDRFVEFPNGSRIYFMAENYANDKELDRFKGLEANGFLLEQLEELQEATYFKCLERSGSWYDCDPMPPPFNFYTFNPTFTWVKKKIYDVYKKGELRKPFYFLEASPRDNPFVTAEQWKQWDLLDDISKAMFIEGMWEVPVDGVYFHEFRSAKHIRPTQFVKTMDLWLSFDFNVDPMTCVVAQTDEQSWVRFIKEYRIANSDTYEMCDRIISDFGELNPYYQITGDASGMNRSSATIGHINHYDIIKEKLGISLSQIKVLSANPGISESRSFCNSIMKSITEFSVDPAMEFTIMDLRFTETGVDTKGHMSIKKTGMNKYAGLDNSQMTHLGDAVRYLLHAILNDWIIMPRS